MDRALSPAALLTRRADQAKRRYELSIQHSAGSSYELKKP